MPITIHDLSIRCTQRDGSHTFPVKDLDLSIRTGETHVLLGESGCGKSITALSLMRLLPENMRFVSGDIRLDDASLLALSESKMQRIRGRHLAMIFQEPMSALNPVMTVGHQIEEVLRWHFHLPKKARYARAIELLDAVALPKPTTCFRHYPHELSGGMRQRVMIAMALAGEPDYLLADEPTTALDVSIQAKIVQLLKDVQAKTQMGILFITHDIGLAGEIADTISVMYGGQVVEHGSREDCLQRPMHPYTKRLLSSLPAWEKRHAPLATIPGDIDFVTETSQGCRFAKRCSLTTDTCRQQSPLLQNPSNGKTPHRFRCHYPDRPLSMPGLTETKDSTTKSDKKPLLLTQNLSIHFDNRQGGIFHRRGKTTAVDNVSLELFPGETLALVGESGSGKTSFGRAIVQLVDWQGKIQFKGMDFAHLKKTDNFRKDIQFIFQDPFAAMNPRLRVGDSILEGALRFGLCDRYNRTAYLATLCQQVGISLSMCDRFPHAFSGGQRQRICIARALAVKPKLIICDEPTSALDISVQAQILNLLKQLQREHGLTYLFITHDFSVVSYLADRIAVMHQGKIVESGVAETILHTPTDPYTKRLLAAVPTKMA